MKYYMDKYGDGDANVDGVLLLVGSFFFQLYTLDSTKSLQDYGIYPQEKIIVEER